MAGGNPSKYIPVPADGVKAELLPKRDSRAAWLLELSQKFLPQDDSISIQRERCKEKGFREVPPLSRSLSSPDWDVLVQEMNEGIGREAGTGGSQTLGAILSPGAGKAPAGVITLREKTNLRIFSPGGVGNEEPGSSLMGISARGKGFQIPILPSASRQRAASASRIPHSGAVGFSPPRSKKRGGSKGSEVL